MIKKKGMEILAGQMVDVIEVNGKMVSKMERVLTETKKVLKRVECG